MDFLFTIEGVKKLPLLSLLFLSSQAFSWSVPQAHLDGKDFDSKHFKGKSFVLFYVNPKYRNLNSDASDALRLQEFDQNQFGSVAIIDLKASWIPNSLVMKGIRKKQIKYPNTVYLKDKKHYMHKILGFKPSGSDIFAFDKNGKMIFKHFGKMNPEQVEEMVEVLKKSLD